MTNREKNKERFDELGDVYFSKNEIFHRFAVRKNGEMVLCAHIPCRDCIFGSGIWSCDKEKEIWLESEAAQDELAPEEKEEKMEKDKIKVGDTVKVTKKGCAEEGEIGTVRSIRRSSSGLNLYGVSFDRDVCGRAFLEREIEKVKVKKTPPRIVIYQNGDTVTVKDLETGETASAVCSKDDTFDFYTGAFIAVSRLTHFVDDIKMMRLETEQIEEDIADMFNFWIGRASGIEWCIKHLNDKFAIQIEYECCLQEKENSARINVQNSVRYYEGRADGVRWCLENFDNLELPEESAGKKE